MVVRHIIFAGLCATASLAQAGIVEAASVPTAPRAAWTFSFGATPMPSSMASSSSQRLMSGGPGSWSMHSRAGDAGGLSRVLLSGNGAKGASFTGAPSVPDVVQAAPPTGGAFTNGPADTSSLGNGGVTGGPSQPPPFTDIAHGGGNDTPAAIPPATELADVIVNLPADLPAVVAPALVPEPATGALLLAGMLGAGALRRRRK
jgi:hypothetical protein